MTTPVPYLLRAMVEDDKAFIYTTWIKIYHEVYPNNFCPQNIYLTNQRKIIDFLLKHSNVLVACVPEDPSTIVGYIVYEFIANVLVIHWMHIKYINRRMNVASDILVSIYPTVKQDPIIITHNFKAFNKLRTKFQLVYDPYLVSNKIIEDK